MISLMSLPLIPIIMQQQREQGRMVEEGGMLLKVQSWWFSLGLLSIWGFIDRVLWLITGQKMDFHYFISIFLLLLINIL